MREKIITADTAEKLIAIAKNLFYKKRVLNKILEIFEKEYSVSTIKNFKVWLETKKENFVDQKEIDAIAVLKELKKKSLRGIKSSQINMSIVLQKLLDRCQCEPINNEYHESGDDALLRYSRLLAYVSKAAEYFGYHILADRGIENIIIHKNNQGFDRFLYGLILLFDASRLEDFNNQHQDDPYFKTLQFCVLMILKIDQLMKHKEIFLNEDQKKQYLNEIMLFLPDCYDATRVSHEELIAIYFVLKDMINNSMVYFLPVDRIDNDRVHKKPLYLYSDRDYFKTAKNIILKCATPNVLPSFDP